MPKPSEKCRGEDRTLEAIRKVVQTKEIDWNQACDELAAEMKAEGLNTTAEFVLSYKTPVVSNKPLPSGLTWSEIPDFNEMKTRNGEDFKKSHASTIC